MVVIPHHTALPASTAKKNGQNELQKSELKLGFMLSCSIVRNVFLVVDPEPQCTGKLIDHIASFRIEQCILHDHSVTMSLDLVNEENV